ncbi:PrsW family glutamic-type intramembrane protease [Adhaeretor mobilis]|uniref:PrsW family intramembrane metalloprotease n=1 Tax=Adhaeretor mobilis TaxID=1930276 RepID=A0A517N026_9BACT|nr:PrsW family glutamic-type intramembrane protease [Adhaeretor mobilis]QDT00475.1 hypothetical protein HG15A2_38130 [Adhaeretor mobilis]
MLSQSQRHWIDLRTHDARFLLWTAASILGLGILVSFAVSGIDPVNNFVAESLEPDLSQPDAPDPETPSPGDPIPEGPSPWEEIEGQARQGEWLDVFLAIPKAMVEGWRSRASIGLAFLVCGCWLAFSLQAIQTPNLHSLRSWACFVGIPLGVLSIWGTLFLLVWQEQFWGLTESEELVPGLRFFILGVGFREEFSKFVCFLPLLPFVLFSRDELAAFITAGCVGLGFALEENIGYFTREWATSTLGRMMTAAPLHMSLTALVGLAAYRACRWPKQWGAHFFGVLGAAILAHGLYDAFIVLPDLVEYNILASIIFILIVWQFFRELKELRKMRRESFSLSANFVICTSTVVAATLVVLSSWLGIHLAAKVLIPSLISQALMAYLFLREMPESLVTV